jgi:hypothetical protein
MSEIPRYRRTPWLIWRGVTAAVMSTVAAGLIVWGSSLFVGRYWVGGIFLDLIGLFLVSIEVWLFVASRGLVANSAERAARLVEVDGTESSSVSLAWNRASYAQ